MVEFNGILVIGEVGDRVMMGDRLLGAEAFKLVKMIKDVNGRFDD